MATIFSLPFLLILLLSNSISLSSQKHHHHHSKSKYPFPSSYSVSFPLTSVSLSPRPSSSQSVNFPSLFSKPISKPYHFRSQFKYSMALIISLPIGTPPQTQQMVLDTGSQLSWIQCHKKAPPLKTIISFDPSLSSSFSLLPCSHPICKPRIPDFTLPTTCDQNRLCHYSYFYADGTLAEGNLVREKITFSPSQITPPLILGCAEASTDPMGILGMNTGRLSFISQARITSFSYCLSLLSVSQTGSFYLGANPNSKAFKYVPLLNPGRNLRSPNYDSLAYTIGMEGIKIGGVKLNISSSVFWADSTGSGQTIIDSGTTYTHLVEVAYNQVRAHIVKLVGSRLKKGYVYDGAMDMCFDSVNRVEIERSIGDMVLLFERGVEILVEKQRILAEVVGGVHCLGIARSEMIGTASNIIGNFHQQNQWVEFDVVNRRIGFGKADCSRSIL